MNQSIHRLDRSDRPDQRRSENPNPKSPNVQREMTFDPKFYGNNNYSTAFGLFGLLLAVPVLFASGEVSVLSAAAKEFKPGGSVSESSAQTVNDGEQESANVSTSKWIQLRPSTKKLLIRVRLKPCYVALPGKKKKCFLYFLCRN